MITKEKIVERIEFLKKRNIQLNDEHQAIIDQINACMGAIQECEFWLAKIEEKG